jgi:hypothetical protein
MRTWESSREKRWQEHEAPFSDDVKSAWNFVKFEVLTTVTMKIAVFWDVI